MTSSDKKLSQLNTLIELSSLINSTLDTGEIRKRAITAATRLMDAEAGSLLLVDRDSGELFFEEAVGDKATEVKKIRLKKGEGIAGWVVGKDEPVIIENVQNDARFFKEADKRSEFLTKNMICAPLKSKGKILGVLEAINKKTGVFNNEDMEVFNALANQVTTAVENAYLYQELKETFYEFTEALADTIEKRDPYTGGHTKRVMTYSAGIGEYLGLSEKDIENLKLASILHDIGKIAVRDNVLLKEGRLTPEETDYINQHPVHGAEIIKHIKQLKDVMPGVKWHHEKYDGSGYPDHLKNGEIPLIARIIAVADTFDAITSDRPYRKALSHEDALNELRKYTGTQFDRETVEAFLAVHKEPDALRVVDRQARKEAV